jgi:glycosyltransferase involved in cell wall biosynthesis
MLRVGIEFSFFDSSWLGGVAAITNLIAAVKTLEDPQIEVVLVAGIRTPDSLLRTVEGIEILRTNLVDPSHWSNLLGRAARRFIGRNVLLERWLMRHGIQVYSHGSPLGRRSRISTLGHIADFGYKYFPYLYDDKTLKRIERGNIRICNEYDFLVVSSRSVERDYHNFFPNASASSVVLNILPAGIPDQRSNRDELSTKYGLPDRFIYSPNQFWVHKNHLLIVEALAIAKSSGRRLDVVCTGLPFDARSPEHFHRVIARTEELGVADQFHVLGVVPYEDAMDLMRHSIAVLSASLFEGWGISVTEADLLGKSLILSDIPPFREQAPDNAHFFDPRDAQALAAELIGVDDLHSEEGDRAAAALKKRQWSRTVKEHAKNYQSIVLAVSRKQRSN